MITKVLYILFLSVLALDYQSEVAGGTWFQASTGYAAVVIGTLAIASAMGRVATISSRQYGVAIAFALFAIIAGIVAFAHRIPMGDFVRTFGPVALMMIGFVATSILVSPARERRQWMFRVLLAIAAVDAIWSVFVAFGIKGLQLSAVRYHVLSTGALMCLGYAVCGLIIWRKSIVVSLFVAVATGVLQLLAVTRSQITATVGMILLGVAVSFRARRRLRRMEASSLSVIALAAGAVLIAFVLAAGTAAWVRPDVWEGWSDRLSRVGARDGMDVSLAIRIAQSLGQLRSLSEHPGDILLGRGYGTEFDLDLQYLFGVISTYETDMSRVYGAGVGLRSNPDSTWIPALYNGGLTWWAFFMWITLCAGLRAWRNARDNSAGESVNLVQWAFLVWGGYILLSFFTNIFIDRFGAAIYGCIIAILLSEGGGAGGIPTQSGLKANGGENKMCVKHENGGIYGRV